MLFTAKKQTLSMAEHKTSSPGKRRLAGLHGRFVPRLRVRFHEMLNGDWIASATLEARAAPHIAARIRTAVPSCCR